MLLLPRRVFQDTRLTVASTSVPTTTQVTLTGGTASVLSRVFHGAIFLLLFRRRKK